MKKLKPNISVLILLIIFLVQITPNLRNYLVTIGNRIPIIVNAQADNYENTIGNNQKLQYLINKFNKIKPSLDSTYIYIDLADEESTMNYYRMRYEFIPMKSVKYQYFGYQILEESDYIRVINEFSIDYILIHRNNGILAFIDPFMADKEDIIFKVENKNGEVLRDMVKEIE